MMPEARPLSRPTAPLQAIETVYGGYRFRSRIEARWANGPQPVLEACGDRRRRFRSRA